MTSFSRLHSAVQHHIVNSLGWRELRPLQESSIAPILEGRHVLLLAPTAGGKTEAAFFPALSQMLAENWGGLSILYLCPLKALLNNLHTRLERYCEWAGRRCELWHGDVSQAARRKIIKDLPDCLLTTPESLEVMLVSAATDHRFLFSGLRVVVIDEIHAFAGDDRGWHLLAILERLRVIAGRELQRIGLSATVGNPQVLLDWFAGHCEGTREVVLVPSNGSVAPDVQVDYVGSLENAATVIARLHQGEKRLVFCDSRSRVEKLATRLREAGVETHVSHSSLSLDERRRAEAAFAQSSNCVIVATSTLELGIDVGDLDRVIQIDSPTTVSSFLQRLGRTGRRSGNSRNCLFLATHPDALLRAVAIVKLWHEGYVEPIEPPPAPFHVFAQQILALCLQERGLGRNAWRRWLLRPPPFAQSPPGQLEEIIDHMVRAEYLSDDGGILFVGQEGEARFGFQNFLDLFAVFMRTPEFEVFCGREHLGSVDRGTFAQHGQTPLVISLGGRSWKVRELDWSGWKAFVEPADYGGRSRWLGSGRAYSFQLCQAVKQVITSEGHFPFLSRRGDQALDESRAEHDWVKPDSTVLRLGANGVDGEWWTFAGRRANEYFCRLLGKTIRLRSIADNFSLRLQTAVSVEDFDKALQTLRSSPARETAPAVVEDLDDLKFAECLPPTALQTLLRDRQEAHREVDIVLAQPLKTSSGVGWGGA
ncbi:MAG TPA: DEAD/DEAH box helicase [Candidatus Paceibacterota bacterium]|nr:DEAD/DEAH box helicase [Candidatus Paceibacterota bacterium]